MADPSRNEPCPCGSGRKFKHCCARQGQAPNSSTASAVTASLDADLRQATKLLSQRRFSQALQVFESVHAQAATLSSHQLQTTVLGMVQCLTEPAVGLAESVRVQRLLLALQLATRVLPERRDIGLLFTNTLIDAERFNEALSVIDPWLTRHPDWLGALNEKAVALLGLKSFAAAEHCARQAMALAPGSIEAHGNLGQALMGLARFNEALEVFARLISLAPRHIAGLSQAALAAAALSQYRQVIEYLRRLSSLQRLSTVQSRLLCWALVEAGQFIEATQVGEALLASEPTEIETALNCGNAWLALTEPVRAMRCYEAALTQAPTHLRLLVAQAMAHKMLGDLDKAQACALKAVAVDADACEALSLAGSLACDHGEFDKAADWFKRALHNNPESAEALIGISRTRRMTSQDSAWLDATNRVLAKPLSVQLKATLLHAVGKYYDDQNMSAEAFKHHAAGNELIYQYGLGYDPALEENRLQQITVRFNADLFTRLAHVGSGSEQPIFIVGMPRSGTTLVEQILASHPEVFAAGELVFWNFASDVFLTSSPSDEQARLRSLSEDYQQILNKHSSLPRIIDKLPANFANLGLIHLSFPHAKIVHLTRHPLDIALSIYFQGFGTAHRYAHRLNDIGHYFECYRAYMRHWQRQLPATVLLTLAYEDLVSDPVSASQRLCAHVGLDWTPQLIQNQAHTRPVLTASGWQVRQPIHRGAVARHVAYLPWLAPLRHLLDSSVGQ
jgi:tetratricopeptide (TPR) repeat protein